MGQIQRRAASRFILFMLVGTFTVSAAADPPSDESIRLIADQMEQWYQEHRSDLDLEEAASLAEQLTADVSFGELSVDHIYALHRLVKLSPIVMEKATIRLHVLAQREDLEGAAAATKLFLLKYESAPDRECEALLRRALAHPRASDNFANGNYYELIRTLSKWEIKESVLREVADELVAASVFFRPELESYKIAAGGQYILTLQSLREVINEGTREGIRVRLLEMTRRKLAEVGDDEGKAGRLRRSIQKLTSPFGTGAFYDHAAPELSFIWTSGESSPSKLSELRGRVVLLDFWATWCRPCRDTFPELRRLQARYVEYDVVILGVTSLQGRHFTATIEKIDTKDDPEREFALMSEFIGPMEMTWPVVFSRQNVYNPEYGVQGIPHVAIIDARGNVRHNGQSHMTSFSEKVARIDTLLEEVGLEFPAPPDEFEE